MYQGVLHRQDSIVRHQEGSCVASGAGLTLKQLLNGYLGVLMLVVVGGPVPDHLSSGILEVPVSSTWSE